MPVWYTVETGKRSVAFLAPSFLASPVSVIDDKSHEGNAIKRMWKFKQTGDRYHTNRPTLTVPFIFLLNTNFRSAAWYISAMERVIIHPAEHWWKRFRAILFFGQFPACYFCGGAALDLCSYVTKLFPTNFKLSAVGMSFLVGASKKPLCLLSCPPIT